MADAYEGPLPPVDGPNRPFWEGARAGRLMLQQCLDCGVHRFPAARYCASCLGERAEWVAASGRGVIESWCVFHKQYFPGLVPPYVVLQVRLEEGVRLFSNPAGLEQADLAIGMPVQAVFERVREEVALVKFAPSTREGDATARDGGTGRPTGEPGGRGNRDG